MVESNLSHAAEAPDFADALENGVRRRAPIARAVYGDIVQFTDFILITAVSVAVALVYHVGLLGTEVDLQRYAAAGIVGATGVTTLLRRDGYYEFEQLLISRGATRAVLSRWLVVIMGLIAFAFALKVSESFSRFWLFAWTVVSAVALVSTRVAANVILRRTVRTGGAFSRRIAIIGSNDIAEKFAALAEGSDQAVSVVGVYASDPSAVGEGCSRALSGDLAALSRAARNGDIDDIVIAQTGLSPEEMRALVNRMSILPVSIALCPNAHWFDHTGGELVKIGGAPLLNLYRRPLEGWGSLIKTIEDKIIGGAMFLAAVPLFALIAIAIKLQGKGPILFSQQRHGFNQEVFRIYKFRTMTVAEDGEKIVQASLDDPRITPLGKILRRYSLDELPQLLNVLKGEMSLVGPRPHALAHNHAYAKIIENYSGRHKVKPGITGWAQVNGFRGETSENEQMADRVRYDLDYIDNWSLLFDLRILVLTISAVLFPKNAH
ncbi:MAG: undecaprenyl-phosphate glucose phosphotransferase [Amphiplicatus sp.]